MDKARTKILLRDIAIGTAIFCAIGYYQLWNIMTVRGMFGWFVMAVVVSSFIAGIAALSRASARHRAELHGILKQYPPPSSIWRWNPPHPFTRWPRRPPKPD